MAAHSQGIRAIPPVAVDQPLAGHPEWLREMAQSVNLTSAWVSNHVVTPGGFAALPVSPTLGALAVITDSNTNAWGAAIAGGGSITVLAWWNGAAWKVAGI